MRPRHGQTTSRRWSLVTQRANTCQPSQTHPTTRTARPTRCPRARLTICAAVGQPRPSLRLATSHMPSAPAATSHRTTFIGLETDATRRSGRTRPSRRRPRRGRLGDQVRAPRSQGSSVSDRCFSEHGRAPTVPLPRKAEPRATTRPRRARQARYPRSRRLKEGRERHHVGDRGSARARASRMPGCGRAPRRR
jgi:hypothetical protein